MAVDRRTHCGLQWVKFWSNSDVLTLIRWYRVPEGTPALPFPHRFLSTDYEGRILPVGRRVGLLGFDNLVEPGQPGAPVGMVHRSQKYNKGALPAGYTPPTGWIGSLRQWQDGSILGVDPPLVWDGPFTSGCKAPLDPNAQACATGCDRAPLVSAIWLMEPFAPFGGLQPTALVKREGCDFASTCVPGGQCAAGTAAAWQVIPEIDRAGVVGGVISYKRSNLWSNGCDRMA